MMFSFQRFLRWRAGLLQVAAILVAAAALGTSGNAIADQAQLGSREERTANAVQRRHEATASERREMREMARERWENASPRERRMFRRGMQDLGRTLPDFSPIERRVLLRRISGLSKAERKALRKRLRGVDDLAPGEREKFVLELRNLLGASPGEAARLERNIDRWRQMSESEREKYREQMRRFRAMSIEDRRVLLDQRVDPEPE